ncbi:MAG TPA: hypothetical protein ENI57_04320 [Ignavibacteria bacterium]|nr:hypothetical protein [Ignavibacteria bacterium]
MQRTWFKLFFVFALISTAFAGAFLDYFHVRSEGDNVVVEWKTSKETNLDKFVVERKSPHGVFIELATVAPKGSNSFYNYTDKGAYKKTDLLFVYRLKIVDTNNQVTYSTEASISLSISGVKRTWGSIKAMFR